jgi:hypothetical protein
MSDLISAAKQALEALETCMYPQQKQFQAITALRQAIEQAEKQEPKPCPTCEALARTVLMDQGGTA